MKSKDKAPDMMKDFRIFKLRRQDVGYDKGKDVYYGDISKKYTLIDFNSSEIPGEIIPSNLLDEIYDLQYNPPSFPRRGEPDYHNRDRNKIMISLSSEQRGRRIENLRGRLLKSISDKENVEKELNEHYKTLTAQHKQISLLSFAFYLSDEWIRQHEEIEYESPLDALKTSSRELKRRFDKIIKTMKSNSAYAPACSYSRLILADEHFRPFYLVNFFFKEGVLNDFFAHDIWHHWMESRPGNENEDEQHGCFYFFDEGHKPKSEDVPGLVMRMPGYFIQHFESDADVASDKLSDLIGEYIPKFKRSKSEILTNDSNGHKSFFHLQAMRYNILNGSRSISSSDDFTYLTAKGRKENTLKNKIIKEKAANKIK